MLRDNRWYLKTARKIWCRSHSEKHRYTCTQYNDGQDNCSLNPHVSCYKWQISWTENKRDRLRKVHFHSSLWQVPHINAQKFSEAEDSKSKFTIWASFCDSLNFRYALLATKLNKFACFKLHSQMENHNNWKKTEMDFAGPISGSLRNNNTCFIINSTAWS